MEACSCFEQVWTCVSGWLWTRTLPQSHPFPRNENKDRKAASHAGSWEMTDGEVALIKMICFHFLHKERRLEKCVHEAQRPHRAVFVSGCTENKNIVQAFRCDRAYLCEAWLTGAHWVDSLMHYLILNVGSFRTTFCFCETWLMCFHTDRLLQ